LVASDAIAIPLLPLPSGRQADGLIIANIEPSHIRPGNEMLPVAVKTHLVYVSLVIPLKTITEMDGVIKCREDVRERPDRHIGPPVKQLSHEAFGLSESPRKLRPRDAPFVHDFANQLRRFKDGALLVECLLFFVGAGDSFEKRLHCGVSFSVLL
jgi:hypothetical protein